MDTKIDIVFLNYDPDGKLRDMADGAKESILRNSKDINFHEVINVSGFVNAVNLGFQMARGRFIVFVANDVEIKDPDWLKKIEQEDSVVGWRLTPFYLTGEMMPDFACWGVSRKTFEKLGFMDKQYENGYGFDDNDYCMRAKELGLGFHDAGINLIHHENKTYQTYFSKLKEDMTERNHKIFVEKWENKLK